MIVTKNGRKIARLAAMAVMGLALGMVTNHTKAAAVTYNFDTNGSTAGFGTDSGTYDWDATTNGGLWSNNSTSTSGNIATNGWVQGNFPKFQPTGTPTYAVTVSNDEQITGIFASTAQNLTINAIGSGVLEAINTGTGADGFLGSGSATVVINAPITGAGQVNPSNGGNISFDGINSYSGGTLLSSSATLIHYNNNSAFGTNTITNSLNSATTLTPLLASGGATVTLANNFTTLATDTAGTGFNFAADANTPVVSTGTWALGSIPVVNLKNNGTSTSPLTLTNTISGSANLVLLGANGGSITFSGGNNYTGTTTVGATSTAAITLILGAANTIASSSKVIMAGGTLNPDGINQAMPATTLGMTASSKLDFGTGASEVDFANSSAVAWTGTLNLANWTFGTDALRFGTDATGLTSAQLADIEFNGDSSTLGTAMLNSSGFVAVPEPASLSLLGLGALGLLARRRK